MSYTLEEKRDWALAGKSRWEARLVTAEGKLASAREMSGGLLGFGGSGNQRAAGQVRAAFGSADRSYAEAAAKIDYYAGKLSYYERTIAERDRPRLTSADLVGALWVRTSTGWRKVVRVNAKSVSVDSGYSWVDRIPLGSVLGVRTA